jgi:hypothetical protein
MRDRERDDGDAPRSEKGSGGFLGRAWSGFGPDPREGTRESKGYADDRAAGWQGEERTAYYDRGERGGRSGERDAGERRPEASGRDASERSRDFGHDDRHAGLPIEETSRLIASNKVEGTPVYSRDRERLGTVYNFMVDKVSGQVEYAVLRYGGFMGMGQRYYPLPWRVLTYHRDAGGYVIDMAARDFENAPSFDRSDEPEFDHEYGRRVHSWYGLEY